MEYWLQYTVNTLLKDFHLSSFTPKPVGYTEVTIDKIILHSAMIIQSKEFELGERK